MPTVIADTQDIRVERREVPKRHALSLLGRIYVEPGSIDDWNQLHELHYKAESLGVGPKFYRCVLDGKTIGVGVMTVPKMLSAGRNAIFTNLRPNNGGKDSRLVNKYRAEWINAHSCTNSRLVLDTIYRGAGIAYRMQNLMMRMTGCRFVEFQSSMSKYNPFAAKAGMKFTKPRRSSSYEKGLAFFRRWFVSDPSDYVSIMDEIAAMKPGVRDKCVEEMRKFYYSCSALEKTGNCRLNGTSRVDNMELSYLLKSLQQLVLASPLYGAYVNPDYGRELPERLPLVCFDNQTPEQPLDVSKVVQQPV